MNISLAMDSGDEQLNKKPGAQLATLRLQKGYPLEYVAGKLHLRVRMIELLEADDYEQMPEPVFIRGYIRAYAKLMDVSGDALIAMYDQFYANERPSERALWQSRRTTNRAEHAVRWVTLFFGAAVLIAVAMWWDKSKDDAVLIPDVVNEAKATPVQSDNEIRLTDLSKMRSLLSSVNQSSLVGDAERE